MSSLRVLRLGHIKGDQVSIECRCCGVEQFLGCLKSTGLLNIINLYYGGIPID